MTILAGIKTQRNTNLSVIINSERQYFFKILQILIWEDETRIKREIIDGAEQIL